MNDEQKDALDYAINATTPLIRVLASTFRVTYPSFVSALKSSFVSAAEDQLLRENRPPGKREYGYLSLLSGVSQSDVKKISSLENKTKRVGDSAICAEAVVISEWDSNRFWQDDSGTPAVLPLYGQYGEKNFSTLVRKCVGNISYGTMANALIGAGVAERVKTGNSKAIKLISAEFEPAKGNELEMFKVGCAMIERLGRATEDNLEMSNDAVEDRHFQHDFFSYKVPFSRLPAFRHALKELLRDFSYNKLVPEMETHEIDEAGPECLTEAGVGLYFWEKRKDGQRLLKYNDDKAT